MLNKLRSLIAGLERKPAKTNASTRRHLASKNQSTQRYRQPQTLLGAEGFALGYLNMPKAACTSIKNILYYLHNGSWCGDPLDVHRAVRYNAVVLSGESYIANRNRLLAEGRPWLNFTFVRNPGPRAYSAFVEKIWATGPYSFPRIRAYLVRNRSLALSPLASIDMPDKKAAADGFCAFLDFVAENLDGRTPFPANAHWCVQSRRVGEALEPNHINFVGRVERFSHDINFVLKQAGYSGPDLGGMRFNEGPKAPFALEEIMDMRIAARLWDIYSEDYITYGYKDPR